MLTDALLFDAEPLRHPARRNMLALRSASPGLAILPELQEQGREEAMGRVPELNASSEHNALARLLDSEANRTCGQAELYAFGLHGCRRSGLHWVLFKGRL